MIFTSYYAGQIKGEAVSISLYPPKGWKKQHLPLFAPTRELLQGWKSSDNAASAQEQYKRQFREILQSRHQMIQLWVSRQQRNPQDITLLCYEKTGDFCHRHQVAEEVLQKYLPELWGGEVSLLAGDPINKDIGITDTPSINLTLSEQHHNIATTTQQPPPINPTFPPIVKSLLAKCHEAGLFVMCLRLPCGYYRVSLDGQDLGDWSELGVLGVLAGLPSEVYRWRLVGKLGSACS